MTGSAAGNGIFIGALSGLSASISAPPEQKYHCVADYELEELMKVEKPIALGLATLSLGAFLGYIPQLLDLLNTAQSSQPIATKDLAFLAVAMLLLGLSIPSGFVAWRGKSRGEKLLEEIRKRPLAIHASGTPQKPAQP